MYRKENHWATSNQVTSPPRVSGAAEQADVKVKLWKGRALVGCDSSRWTQWLGKSFQFCVPACFALTARYLSADEDSRSLLPVLFISCIIIMAFF